MPSSIAQNRTATIDEFGELDRQLAEFKPILDRHAALRLQIHAWIADHDPASPLTLDGRHYSIQVSARANQRRISNMRKLFRLLGQAKFLEFCSFPLAALDRLPLLDTTPFLSEERTGNRTLRAVARVPARGASA